jgi:hypothetical protein
MNASYKGVNKGQLCSLTPKINDCHLFHSFFKLNCRCSVWIVEFLLTEFLFALIAYLIELRALIS